MKLSQLLTAPNQLTLLRMMFLPFIVIKLVEGHYSLALILFVLAGMSDVTLILQAIEDLLRLRRLRGAACACTPSLAPLLRGAT